MNYLFKGGEKIRKRRKQKPSKRILFFIYLFSHICLVHPFVYLQSAYPGQTLAYWAGRGYWDWTCVSKCRSLFWFCLMIWVGSHPLPSMICLIKYCIGMNGAMTTASRSTSFPREKDCQMKYSLPWLLPFSVCF